MCNNEAKLIDEILYDLGERYEKDVYWTVSKIIEKYKKKKEELDNRKCLFCSCGLKEYDKYACDKCKKKHNFNEEELIQKMREYGTGAD